MMLVWITILGCISGQKLQMEDFADSSPSQNSEDSIENLDTAEEQALLSEECDDAFLLQLNFSTYAATIWQYDLATMALVELGNPECTFNVSGDYMIAMTADSKGQLWMLSRYGDIYKVVPANLYCNFTGLNFMTEQLSPQGLAFMRDDAESSEVLYASGVSSTDQQAYLTVQSGNGISVIGAVAGTSEGDNIIDLAGTADGRLFGLRPSGLQSALTEIDPNSGAPLNDWLLGIPAPNGWSFVSLFGNFWTFTSEVGSNTEVHFFNPQTENLIHKDTLGFQTVGAALPTCAPETSGS